MRSRKIQSENNYTNRQNGFQGKNIIRNRIIIHIDKKRQSGRQNNSKLICV